VFCCDPCASLQDLPDPHNTMKMIILAFCVALALVSAAPKVDVKFFGESLCPFCRDFIANGVNKTLSTPDIMAITDFTFIPWGNAYYITKECGGSSVYDHDTRLCWSMNCSKASPPADCYTGAKTCQHGTGECYGNAVETCAKNQANGDVLKFMNFVYCFEVKGTATVNDLRRCAPEFGFDVNALVTCSAAEEGIVAEAKLTVQLAPDHSGVPWVTINGRGESAPADLTAAICAAYTGPKPASCPQLRMSL